MDFTHILQDVLMLGIPLIVGLQTWIIKELYNLKTWKSEINKDLEGKSTHSLRINKIEDWLIRAEAVTEPDRELRRELPVALEILKQHGQELQHMRDSLLLLQKEINTKLEGISHAIKDIQSNCVMHKMLTAGKADILANFIDKEINKEMKKD